MIGVRLTKFPVALISGILYTLSQPKFNVFPFAFLFSLPLHIWWRKEGKNLNVGWFSAISVFFFGGFFAFFFTIHWITHAITYYGGFSYIFALLPLSLLSATLGFFVFIFGLARAKLRELGIPFAISDPLIWVSTEYIKTFFLTGFPWALVGYSLWKYPDIIQIADITGVYGVSFMIMAVSGALCDIYDVISGREKKKTLYSIIFPILFVLLSLLYGKVRIEMIKEYEKSVDEIPAVVVQSAIPQDVKWDEEFKEKTFYDNITLTFSAIDSNYKEVLAVWPETAFTFLLEKEERFKDELLGFTKKGFYVVAGGLGYSIENGKIKYRNRAFFITPKMEINHYDKTHLVIFGEYIPLRSTLEKIPFVKKIIEDVEKVAGDFTPGNKVYAMGDEKIKVAVPICFESIFPYLVKDMVHDGANLITVITNDAWFGYSSGPYQHFSVSVFRAVEMRRYILRSANTGVSGAFDPTGKILKETKMFEKTSFLIKVKPLDIKTFYMKYGDIFSVVCCIASFMLIVISLRKEKKKRNK